MQEDEQTNILNHRRFWFPGRAAVAPSTNAAPLTSVNALLDSAANADKSTPSSRRGSVDAKDPQSQASLPPSSSSDKLGALAASVTPSTSRSVKLR